MKQLKYWLPLLVLILISCQTGTENNNITDETSGIKTETTVESRLDPDLPSKNFEGMEFVFLNRGLEENGTIKHFSEAASNEENGELMNDAVYRRNRSIEAKYNVEIKGVISNDLRSLVSDITKSVNSGSDTYDAAFPGIYDASSLSQSGYLTDLKTVPNFNFAQPWWDQRAVNDLSIGGKLFFTVGDITPWAYPFTHITIVNKELITQYNLESPYDLVRKNNWTFDKFYELCVAVSGDTNGDGVIDEKDRHGVLLAREQYTMQIIGGGESFIKKDKDDLPYVAINNDRAANVAQKLFNIMTDKEAVLILEDYRSGYSDPWFEVLYNPFRDGNGLFIMSWMSLMSIYRDLETDIGLLPMPKYDSFQNGYYSMISSTWASALVIPITNDKLDATGFILEALCAESMYTVRPAFYEQTLINKMMRDEDSSEMLDIILASRTYDLGAIYNWGDIYGAFSNMLGRGSFTFASDIASLATRIETEINKFIANINKGE